MPGGVSPLSLRGPCPLSTWAWPPLYVGEAPYIRGRSPYYTWARPPLYVGGAPTIRGRGPLYTWARPPYICTRRGAHMYVGGAPIRGQWPPPARGRSPLAAVGRVPFPVWASTIVGRGPLLRFVARGHSLRWAVPLSSLRRPSLLSPRGESRCLHGLSRPASTTTAGLESHGARLACTLAAAVGALGAVWRKDAVCTLAREGRGPGRNSPQRGVGRPASPPGGRGSGGPTGPRGP
jgi:hypothetical protein